MTDSTKTTATNDRIVVKLVPTNVFTRWPCHVCGSQTEKVSILAEAGDPLSDDLVRVCERCLEAGDIDERLEAHARSLDDDADWVRALIGRLEVPTYAAWVHACDQYAAEMKEAWDSSDGEVF